MRAAKTGNSEKVQKLLKVHEANPNTKEIDTVSVLSHHTASFRHFILDEASMDSSDMGQSQRT